jgi:ankyrin repeat protein
MDSDKAAAWAEGRQLLIGSFDAVAKNDIPTLDSLLASKSDLEDLLNSLKDGNGRHLVHMAASNGRLEMLRYLEQKGADLTLADDEGETIASLAFRHEQKEVIEYVKIHYPQLLKASNNKGMTLLHIAAEMGSTELAKTVIELGVDVNAESQNGTPLELSVAWKQKEMVTFLLSYGAKPEGSCGKHMPPAILMAVSMGDDAIQIVEALLQAGADLNTKDEHGCGVLECAAECNSGNIIDLLLRHGAKVTGKVILAAFRDSHKEALERLLPPLKPADLVTSSSSSDPSKALELKERGNQAFELGQLSTAISLYTEAISQDPLNSLLYSNRSLAFFKENQFEDSLQDAVLSRTLDSQNMKAYFREACALEKLGRTLEALSAIWKLVREDPVNQTLSKYFRQLAESLD